MLQGAVLDCDALWQPGRFAEGASGQGRDIKVSAV